VKVSRNDLNSIRGTERVLWALINAVGFTYDSEDGSYIIPDEPGSLGPGEGGNPTQLPPNLVYHDDLNAIITEVNKRVLTDVYEVTNRIIDSADASSSELPLDLQLDITLPNEVKAADSLDINLFATFGNTSSKTEFVYVGIGENDKLPQMWTALPLGNIKGAKLRINTGFGYYGRQTFPANTTFRAWAWTTGDGVNLTTEATDPDHRLELRHIRKSV
jgi:hypothetical protein